MANSSIAYFPFMTDNTENCMKRCEDVNDTMISALKVWILTPKGSRRGSTIGCFLLDILFNIFSFTDLKGLAARLKRDASDQFPEINFINVEMNMDKSDNISTLIVKFVISTPVTEISEFEVLFPISNTF